MPRLTSNQYHMQDEELRAKYWERVAKVNTRMEALKRGAQSQMARDIPTSSSLLAQVRQSKRVSVVTLEAMERWLDEHEQEWVLEGAAN